MVAVVFKNIFLTSQNDAVGNMDVMKEDQNIAKTYFSSWLMNKQVGRCFAVNRFLLGRCPTTKS